MNLPLPIQQKLEAVLNEKIIETKVLYGGDINHALKLSTHKEHFFLKWNNKQLYPRIFEREAQGLQLIEATQSICTPICIEANTCEDDAYLLLSFIDKGKMSKSFWEDFGRQIAKMHQSTAPTFGLAQDNYIGTLNQSNKQHENFIAFFIYERLEKQLELAEKNNKISHHFRKRFEELYKLLPSLIPTEAPALLHGDLWTGNFICNQAGEPCIYDPAVYYGHREVDLAMSTLFGQFDKRFYEAYNEEFKLEDGWKNRLDIYNLYPLLVHANLFGESYLSEVEGIMSKYKL